MGRATAQKTALFVITRVAGRTKQEWHLPSPHGDQRYLLGDKPVNRLPEPDFPAPDSEPESTRPGLLKRLFKAITPTTPTYQEPEDTGLPATQ